jgi:hypothetical protein
VTVTSGGWQYQGLNGGHGPLCCFCFSTISLTSITSVRFCTNCSSLESGREEEEGGHTRTVAQQAGVNVVFVHSHTLFGSMVVGPVTNVPLTLRIRRLVLFRAVDGVRGGNRVRGKGKYSLLRARGMESQC